MSFSVFVSSLRPILKKDEYLESCDRTLKSISSQTLPAWTTMRELYGQDNFKSKELKNVIETIRATTRPKKMLDGVEAALKNAVQTLMFLKERGDRIFANAEARSALTYEKATMIRVVQAAEYANQYARKLLNFIYVAEAAAYKVESAPLSRKEREFVLNNVATFCTCLDIISVDHNKVAERIKSIPDAIVSEITEGTVMQARGAGMLDPLSVRGLSVSVNPFYMIGMWVAEYQASVYKSTEDELQLLQMRHMQLLKLQEKQNDPQLEKDIAYMQDRITQAQARLEELQRDYRLED